MVAMFLGALYLISPSSVLKCIHCSVILMIVPRGLCAADGLSGFPAFLLNWIRCPTRSLFSSVVLSWFSSFSTDPSSISNARISFVIAFISLCSVLALSRRFSSRLVVVSCASSFVSVSFLVIHAVWMVFS